MSRRSSSKASSYVRVNQAPDPITAWEVAKRHRAAGKRGRSNPGVTDLLVAIPNPAGRLSRPKVEASSMARRKLKRRARRRNVGLEMALPVARPNIGSRSIMATRRKGGSVRKANTGTKRFAKVLARTPKRYRAPVERALAAGAADAVVYARLPVGRKRPGAKRKYKVTARVLPYRRGKGTPSGVVAAKRAQLERLKTFAGRSQAGRILRLERQIEQAESGVGTVRVSRRASKKLGGPVARRRGRRKSATRRVGAKRRTSRSVGTKRRSTRRTARSTARARKAAATRAAKKRRRSLAARKAARTRKRRAAARAHSVAPKRRNKRRRKSRSVAAKRPRRSLRAAVRSARGSSRGKRRRRYGKAYKRWSARSRIARSVSPRLRKRAWRRAFGLRHNPLDSMALSRPFGGGLGGLSSFGRRSAGGVAGFLSDGWRVAKANKLGMALGVVGGVWGGLVLTNKLDAATGNSAWKTSLATVLAGGAVVWAGSKANDRFGSRGAKGTLGSLLATAGYVIATIGVLKAIDAYAAGGLVFSWLRGLPVVRSLPGVNGLYDAAFSGTGRYLLDPEPLRGVGAYYATQPGLSGAYYAAPSQMSGVGQLYAAPAGMGQVYAAPAGAGGIYVQDPNQLTGVGGGSHLPLISSNQIQSMVESWQTDEDSGSPVAMDMLPSPTEQQIGDTIPVGGQPVPITKPWGQPVRPQGIFADSTFGGTASAYHMG